MKNDLNLFAYCAEKQPNGQRAIEEVERQTTFLIPDVFLKIRSQLRMLLREHVSRDMKILNKLKINLFHRPLVGVLV